MMTGRIPALAALQRTFSMACIKEMQRSPASEVFMVVGVDSTMELPSEPDSGSASSSSCVQLVSAPITVSGTFVELAESSNFVTGTSCVRPIGRLQGRPVGL